MNFWTTLTQKGYFRYKQEENENHHGTSNIQNYLGSKFQLQQTILIFETNFPEKRILPVENIKKWTSSLNSSNSNWCNYKIPA